MVENNTYHFRDVVKMHIHLISSDKYSFDRKMMWELEVLLIVKGNAYQSCFVQKTKT